MFPPRSHIELHVSYAVIFYDNYLEDGLVVPVRVDLPKLACDPVVLPHKQGVKHRQHLKVIFHLISVQGPTFELTDLLKYSFMREHKLE